MAVPPLSLLVLITALCGIVGGVAFLLGASPAALAIPSLSAALVALGTALAFMMAVVGVSLPETILLRRVLKPQLIAIFIGIVTVAIIITGYLFNLIL